MSRFDTNFRLVIRDASSVKCTSAIISDGICASFSAHSISDARSFGFAAALVFRPDMFAESIGARGRVSSVAIKHFRQGMRESTCYFRKTSAICARSEANLIAVPSNLRL